MKDKEEFTKKVDELMEDIKLRAEFEFDSVWQNMQRDPIVNNLIDPRFLAIAKRIMKHGYVSGAQSAVLIIMEKIANDLCE
jgi:hypothetical protein